jgi:hypothetical protein
MAVEKRIWYSAGQRYPYEERKTRIALRTKRFEGG